MPGYNIDIIRKKMAIIRQYHIRRDIIIFIILLLYFYFTNSSILYPSKNLALLMYNYSQGPKAQNVSAAGLYKKLPNTSSLPLPRIATHLGSIVGNFHPIIKRDLLMIYHTTIDKILFCWIR